MNSLPIGLSCILLLQSAAPPLPAQQAPQPQLNIVVVEGEAGINNIHQHTGRDVIVQVEDGNKKPIAGAAVSFSLPSQGPTGAFPNGSRSLTVVTGDDGRAAMRGITPNQLAGKVEIHVNASQGGLTARRIVTQFNMNVPRTAKSGGGGKAIAILLLIGAGAAGGAFAATRAKSSGGGSAAGPTTPPAPTPISITPGSGTFGPPQ